MAAYHKIFSDGSPNNRQREMIFRPVVTPFLPSYWGDIFLRNNSENQGEAEQLGERIETLKEKVSSMLRVRESKTSDKVLLINTIERLGLSHHFEEEIEQQLEQIFELIYVKSWPDQHYDLFNTAMQFRLFRLHGYNIPCSVFDKFKDEDNKFLKTLSSDIKGLLSFYEASELRVQGEDILEEGVAFAKHHLRLVKSQLESPLRERVSYALEHTVHKGIPVLESLNFITIYEKEVSKDYDQVLLTLAKLNLQFLQGLYKSELCHLTGWWKELDLHSKIPHTRDRIVESYFWGVALYFEPQYSFARSAVAKSIIVATILDDTYDNYGTLDELEIFTQAIQRWDIKEIDGLPDYMKTIYKFILSVYEEFDCEASDQGRSYAVSCAIEAVKQLAEAYRTEANWFMRKQVPTFDDALPIGIVISLAFVVLTASFISLDFATKREFDWLMNQPKIVVAASLIGRCRKDIASYQRESKNGQNAIDYYMKQHGVSKEEAVLKLVEIAEDSWMTVNQEWIHTTSIPRQILKSVLNFSRGAEVSYASGKDGFTFPEATLKSHIIALFLDPIKSFNFHLVKHIAQDADWHKRKHMPTFEDALSIGIVISTFFVIFTASYIFFDSAVKPDFHWLMNRKS